MRPYLKPTANGSGEAVKHKRPKQCTRHLRGPAKETSARKRCSKHSGETEWCINLEILRVVEQVWERGGGLAEIPRRANLALPTAPPAGASREEEIAHNRLLKKLRQQNVDLYGLRCNLMLQLAVSSSVPPPRCPNLMPFSQWRSRSAANAKPTGSESHR